jgi:hypothetical protein
LGRENGKVLADTVVPALTTLVAQRYRRGMPAPEQQRYRVDESLASCCVDALAGTLPWLVDHGHKVGVVHTHTRT